MLLNTEQAATDDPRLTQTTFHSNPGEYLSAAIAYGQGGHEASPGDSLAPFYQDPSQRVLAIVLYAADYMTVFVVKVEALLRLARERGSADIEWEEWRAYVVMVSFRQELRPRLWVSGSRLLSIELNPDSDLVSWMDVLDFSPWESALHVETVSHAFPDFVWGILPPIDSNILELPCDTIEIVFLNCGHDSLVYLMVRIPRSLNLVKT